MTPQEKAKQLYNKFNPHCLVKNFYGDDVEVASTKQCALIAVDEILNVGFMDTNDLYDYWQEVKQEIKNL